MSIPSEDYNDYIIKLAFEGFDPDTIARLLHCDVEVVQNALEKQNDGSV